MVDDREEEERELRKLVSPRRSLDERERGAQERESGKGREDQEDGGMENLAMGFYVPFGEVSSLFLPVFFKELNTRESKNIKLGRKKSYG